MIYDPWKNRKAIQEMAAFEVHLQIDWSEDLFVRLDESLESLLADDVAVVTKRHSFKEIRVQLARELPVRAA